ncbi:hypothetical protein FBT96_14325 [Rhodobacter capsulatus]|uniref:Phage tail lysozyme domain-containing protein n=1 Tax=Rhodobacter capsulatus TaxID=1061 RepID=A0A4V5PNZ6_RHOCA|nr:phage tail tip lysozyme [Rhodobacter capsulatus]TKD17404.1 hypothetical protein FBT96_14325 [Rhodobacter capsulatus]
MSGPFVYELIFKGNATSATAAAKEVLAATDALAAETQGAAAVTNQDTAATVQNANAKRNAASASREAAAAAEAEARAREALRKSALPDPMPLQPPPPVLPPAHVPTPLPMPATPTGSQQSGAGAAYAANLGYQFNDIAMMTMAGQNPMMLMMQQGTQVTQVMGQMRASGLSVGTALRGAFMGMLNPMSLATMAVIGFGTAAVQWLMDTREGTKDLDQALSDLQSSTKSLDGAMKAAKEGSSDLVEQYGSGAKAAREMNLAILTLSRAKSALDLKDALGSIGEKIGDVSTFGVVRLQKLEEQFNLTNKGAVGVKDALDLFLHAKTNEDRQIFAQRLATALAQAEYATGGATREALAFGENVAKVALEAQNVKGTTEQIDALVKSVAKTDMGAPYKSGAEKGKELLGILSDLRNVMKETRGPYDLADDLEMTQRIAKATAEYGADSLEVKRLQIEAERQDFERQLRDMTQLTEAHKQELRERWEAAKGLNSADPFGTIAAGRDYLRTQAESIAKTQLELSLVGQTEETRRRVLALYEAELEIRQRNINPDSSLAAMMRDASVTASEAEATLKRISDGWGTVTKAGETAIDGIFDALKQGDVKGAFDSLADEIGSMFEQLAITNPLKNAIFGSDYSTMFDVGGLSGIWDRLTGKAGPIDGSKLAATAAAQSVANMNVTAATVILGGTGIGALAGGIGAGGGMGGLQGTSDVQSQVWNYFSAKGLKPHQVAAIMGNVQAESGFNPTIPGDGGTSLGLFQHHGARADGLLSSLGGRQNLGNVQGQLDYVWKELNSSHSGALAALKAAPDVSSATNAWMRQFERPSDDAMQKSWSTRLGAAEQAMAKFGTTTTLATGQLGTMGTGFDKFGQALGGAVQGGGGGGFWGTLFSGIMSGLGIPGFAGGGRHDGGLRIVGESGPEVEYTGPSTIVPADLTQRILTGGAPAASATQIDARPVINITNNSSVPVQGEVQETTDSRGQRRFELVMADAVAKGLTAGGGQARRTMRDYYGINPVGIAR